MGIVEHSQPMVLVVVGQKGENGLSCHGSAPSTRPPLHYLKASRAQDDGQLAGTDRRSFPRGYQLL